MYEANSACGNFSTGENPKTQKVFVTVTDLNVKCPIVVEIKANKTDKSKNFLADLMIYFEILAQIQLKRQLLSVQNSHHLILWKKVKKKHGRTTIKSGA